MRTSLIYKVLLVVFGTLAMLCFTIILFTLDPSSSQNTTNTTANSMTQFYPFIVPSFGFTNTTICTAPKSLGRKDLHVASTVVYKPTITVVEVLTIEPLGHSQFSITDQEPSTTPTTTADLLSNDHTTTMWEIDVLTVIPLPSIPSHTVSQSSTSPPTITSLAPVDSQSHAISTSTSRSTSHPTTSTIKLKSALCFDPDKQKDLPCSTTTSATLSSLSSSSTWAFSPVSASTVGVAIGPAAQAGPANQANTPIQLTQLSPATKSAPRHRRVHRPNYETVLLVLMAIASFISSIQGVERHGPFLSLIFGMIAGWIFAHEVFGNQ